jgi:hypothetical protein
VREKAGWRVDDVFFEDDDGAFPATRSMRYQINEENQHVLDQARDVSKVLDWVFTYLSQRDMLDRIERSMAFPVQICDKAGNCQAVAKQDPRLQQTLNVLHRAYYNGDTNETISWSNFFAKENPERLVEGTTVKMDALELTFQGKAWWITKIDLKALGRRIPVH